MSKRKYLFTERAHLMCPNMGFAIAFTVKSPYDENRIKETIKVLSEAHPFLNSVIGYENDTNAYFYDVTDSPKTELNLTGMEISGIEAPEIIYEYDRIMGRDFDLFNEGMLKVSVWKSGDETVFLLTLHHLLADGRGALMLAEQLASYYKDGTKPAFAEEKLIESAEDLPKNSEMPLISRWFTNNANKNWKKENRILSYEEYHKLADVFLKTDRVKHTLSEISSAELTKLIDGCKMHDVTVNDYLMAEFMIREKAKSAVVASDLRDKLTCINEDSLGNFATAFSVSVSKKSDDIWEVSKELHSAIQKKINTPSELCLVLSCYAMLEPGLLDAAFVSAKRLYESKAGEFIGKYYFHFDKPHGYSITNLGKADCDAIGAAFFIPPASPAAIKILGVLTMNGTLRICSSER